MLSFLTNQINQSISDMCVMLAKSNCVTNNWPYQGAEMAKGSFQSLFVSKPRECQLKEGVFVLKSIAYYLNIKIIKRHTMIWIFS